MQNGSQRHKDKRTSEDFFRKIYTSHFIVRVRKGLLRVLLWEGVGDRIELQYIDPHSYGHQRCVFLILQSCSTGRPGAQLSAGWWLSLLHLITNLSPKLHRESWGPLRPGVAFPTTSCLQRLWSPTHQGPKSPLRRAFSTTSHQQLSGPQLTDFLSSQSYIIVQRPLNPWNGMFDRHQAEITVMQFRGHSLLVHQSMSVSWDFYLVPFHQPNLPTRSLSITGHWNVPLPSGASLWNGMFGRVEGQNTTIHYNDSNFSGGGMPIL